MADVDLLPSRGIRTATLVDGNGIAANGSQTVAQLAARGMRAECAVDATGVSTSGANMLQIAQRGFRAFCPVNELGIAQDASTTADMLRRRGIRPVVLLDANGIALNGSANMATLAQRGLQSFCPLDETGNATTMGAVILVSNSTVLDNATIGSNVGTLSVSGGTGTYTFTLTSNPGSLFATAGTNGVNLNTAAALTVGDKPITVQAAGGVPTPISRSLIVTVVPSPTLPANTVLPVISGTAALGQTLTTTNGTWTGFPAPGFTYQWKRGGVAISGATGITYLLVSADVGTNITVTVTATNTAGNASATSAAVGPVAGSGPVFLTAGTGAFALAGEDMTATAGWTLTAGAGAFALVDPGTTQLKPPPAAYPGNVSGWGTAYGYWGLRAYNATKIGANCIDVCANMNGAAVSLTTVVIGSNGYADLTPIGFSPIYVQRIYDQAGSPAQDLFYPGAGDRPVLTASMVGGKPAILFPQSFSMQSSASARAQAQPFSIGVVSRSNTFTSNGLIICDGTPACLPLFVSGANAIGINLGVFTSNYTVPDNTFNSLISVASSTPTASGGSSTMCINGAAPAAVAGGVGANGFGSTNKLSMGGTDGGGILFNGYIYELIIKAGMVSAVDQAALSANQHIIGTGW